MKRFHAALRAGGLCLVGFCFVFRVFVPFLHRKKAKVAWVICFSEASQSDTAHFNQLHKETSQKLNPRGCLIYTFNFNFIGIGNAEANICFQSLVFLNFKRSIPILLSTPRSPNRDAWKVSCFGEYSRILKTKSMSSTSEMPESYPQNRKCVMSIARPRQLALKLNVNFTTQVLTMNNARLNRALFSYHNIL